MGETCQHDKQLRAATLSAESDGSAREVPASALTKVSACQASCALRYLRASDGGGAFGLWGAWPSETRRERSGSKTALAPTSPLDRLHRLRRELLEMTQLCKLMDDVNQAKKRVLMPE
jgi:hypothetical protein